jgi:hypothetical protein
MASANKKVRCIEEPLKLLPTRGSWISEIKQPSRDHFPPTPFFSCPRLFGGEMCVILVRYCNTEAARYRQTLMLAYRSWCHVRIRAYRIVLTIQPILQASST